MPLGPCLGGSWLGAMCQKSTGRKRKRRAAMTTVIALEIAIAGASVTVDPAPAHVDDQGLDDAEPIPSSMSVSQDASVDIQVDRCGGLDACVLPLPALQQHDAQAAKYDKYSRLDWLRRAFNAASLEDQEDLPIPEARDEARHARNNYHLYEEIGHGKFSKVYKGRKKFTIRFVAVKSFEKSRREKVLIEVDILSKLNHPNVLGLINWYETRNHLWVIFEYCAGGDLLRLLKQDSSLPEDQVRAFGVDICAGLLHVHSCGFVYGDLKPANILFDENGSLKLCDFGQAQRVDDIERALAEGRQPPRKGSPQYMAAELFLEGGIHSFASDLWSLGCVLFELLKGAPPFNSVSFQQLQHLVLSEVPPPTRASRDFQDLTMQLLRKSPVERITWPSLRLHGWWGGQAPGDSRDVQVLAGERLGFLQRS
ncbi:RUK [Symbiodinium natans]|uniref:RUK protein n=1 Tax=Symbiodinium natans TaxID=878477 RepID=A0A812NFA1_9DINO|nr:RUK [Symbiodinium natans]